MNNTSVDSYLRDGCGRCEHYKTPACKVHRWTKALEALRELVLASGLVEEMKWGCPCYTLGGKNVVMVTAFKEYCALQFFKGAALVDDAGVLESPGPNSRFARFLKFQSVEDVIARRPVARRLVDQAIALERAGTKVAPKAAPEPVPVELERRLAADPALRRAFEALTPGRQRSHILHISGAKQSETRERRVDRCAPDILSGRGFNER
ncbi:hypothetical protein HPC49_09035 [Pyxidicoccus fallax]|uniref:YdhG-like domain-containing protein n=1 Tax=Pyxidicoccus fallax TaxID=394095 RepID=A0A848LCS0_9BACT|nr:YdeI/OmpD-associated family protein [Pyxidicoccus fallax]NMO16779.1 hypothetical protein [Pyxidicoccus fallax]NPC78389.1 hypothetical protein [Pyxidicoccus fallax]